MKKQDDEVPADEVFLPNVKDNEAHADEVLANEVPAQTQYDDFDDYGVNF